MFRYLLTAGIIAGLLGIAAIATVYFYIRPELPSVEVLKDVKLQTPMKVFTRDGKLISQFGVKRRIPLTLDEVPQPLIDAVLATEDSRFYEHPGIDPIGIVRAALNLLVTGEKGQGGSTLTMQLARGFFLTRDKTYIRKLKEIFIAWHIERVLTKDEILLLYLNKIELGHRAFGFGAAAQVYYGKDISELTLAQFATLAGLPKAPSTLNPISRPERSVNRRKIVLSRMMTEGYIDVEQYREAANAPVTASLHGAEIELDAPYLANVIYNEMITLYGKEEAETGGYHVYSTVPYDLQLAAQNALKQNLHDYDERHGYRGVNAQLWQSYQATEALETTPDMAWTEQKVLEYLAKRESFPPLVPAIVTQILDEQNAVTVLDKSGNYRHIPWDGLAWARPYITDTRQGEDPETVRDILSEGAAIWIRYRQEDDIWQLSQFPAASSALVALDPNNGAVRSLVGGYSFYQSQFNRATQARRQVGSNIKPFLYSAALENGYTIASIINDAPINQWDRSSGRAWRPENSPAVYDGPIRMRIALGKSKNVVAVRLLRAVGIDNVRQHMRQFGFELDDLPRDESLSLGSASITPLEVANGFATIANGGYAVQSHFIERIEGQFGEYVWQANPATACPVCEVNQHKLTAQLEANESNQENKIDEPLPPQAKQVVSEQNAFLVQEMMHTAITGSGSWRNKTYWQGTGWRANVLLKRKDLAGKTGTTNDSKDTWFSGFHPNLVATAWVGFDDPSRSLGRTSPNRYLVNKMGDRANYIGNSMFGGEDGAKAAQPAWIRFMQEALQDIPEQTKAIPAGITTVRIDRTTGKLTTRTDHTSRFEYFKAGTEPKSYVTEEEIVDPKKEQEANQQEEEDIF
ncbi:MAG: penicillin-binding protein 1A [Aestuariibacter sp.]